MSTFDHLLVLLANRFGPEVMDTVVSWTKSLCADILRRQLLNHVNGNKVGQIDHEAHAHNLSSWSVLDLGTGNGLLLHELAKHGYYSSTVTPDLLTEHLL